MEFTKYIQEFKQSLQSQLSEFTFKTENFVTEMEQKQKHFDNLQEDISDKQNEITNYQKVSFVKQLDRQLEEQKKQTNVFKLRIRSLQKRIQTLETKNQKLRKGIIDIDYTQYDELFSNLFKNYKRYNKVKIIDIVQELFTLFRGNNVLETIVNTQKQTTSKTTTTTPKTTPNPITTTSIITNIHGCVTTASTDGACSGNPGPGGWGALYRFEDGTVEELGGSEPSTTNNRMELKAALVLLEHLKEQPRKPGLEIRTDSKYLIDGFNKWIIGWKKKNWRTSSGKPVLNKDLWQALDCARLEDVSFVHVKGHSGDPDNNRVDQIAVSFSKGKIPTLNSLKHNIRTPNTFITDKTVEHDNIVYNVIEYKQKQYYIDTNTNTIYRKKKSGKIGKIYGILNNKTIEKR